MQAFNPYLPSWEYVPDGEPRIFDGRLYVYGSHDAFNGDEFCINDYVCWSAPTDNLADWKYEGVIYRASQDPRNTKGNMHMCAPDCVKGTDGRYYLYYQMSVLQCTSVAVSDNPAGPFEYYGKVQHVDGTPWGEKKGDTFAFDPAVLVDDDGKVYCYVGFAPEGAFKLLLKMRGNSLEGAVCLELDSDMITVKGEEHKVVPGPETAKETGFEGHAFYEASSIRKINGRYYYVYSSQLSHELCYAVSNSPTGGFQYGGTLVSIGDVGLDGRTEKDAVNNLGNTHGGMVCVHDQWYIFYHRQTNKQKCCRQGCAEKIYIEPDGRIKQAEVTSCGLNHGPLEGKGTYEARIACILTSQDGVLNYTDTRVKDKKNKYPYFTQSGVDREENPDQYIANMKNGATAGFKYFNLKGKTNVSVKVRGEGAGEMEIRLKPENTPVAKIEIAGGKKYRNFESAAPINAEGICALYFTYKGSGYIDFMEFTLY